MKKYNQGACSARLSGSDRRNRPAVLRDRYLEKMIDQLNDDMEGC